MIGTDYMNDPTIHNIFPSNQEKSHIAICMLQDCLDDISDEIGYKYGFNSNIYNSIRNKIYQEREKIKKFV